MILKNKYCSKSIVKCINSVHIGVGSGVKSHGYKNKKQKQLILNGHHKMFCHEINEIDEYNCCASILQDGILQEHCDVSHNGLETLWLLHNGWWSQFQLLNAMIAIKETKLVFWQENASTSNSAGKCLWNENEMRDETKLLDRIASEKYVEEISLRIKHVIMGCN